MFQPKKLLTLLLALLMVLTAFTACNNEKSPEEESTTPDTGDSSDTEVREPSPLDGVTLNNEVLKVLSWKASNLPEYVEELTESSDLVEQEVYHRCDYAESRLKVKTSWNIIPNDSNFVDTAFRENQAGGTNDMIVSVSSYAHSLTSRGVFSNLTQYDYFGDFEHSTWPESLLDDITVGNKLYFATGDISTNLIFMTSVVFFNKGLVKTLGINEKIQAEYDAADLYELVTTGRWTLDKMIKLCEGVYKEQTNDGIKSGGDRFGLNTYNTLLDNFYYGGGYTTVVPEDGEFVISENFLDPVLMNGILSQINEFLHDSSDGFFQTGQNPHNPVQAEFANGNVLFSLAPASHAYHTHSNREDLDYSVLPVPKHVESQERYCCTQSFPYSVYGIASQSKNAKSTAAFMQALAEESYYTTRPALFDKMMKGRYAEEPEDAEMWEYAVDANVFDVGRVFCEAFGEDRDDQWTVKVFRERITQNNENWSSALDTYVVPLMIAASTLASEIKALPD